MFNICNVVMVEIPWFKLCIYVYDTKCIGIYDDDDTNKCSVEIRFSFFSLSIRYIMT